MWQPKIEARILQALAPTTRDHVLEVGNGQRLSDGLARQLLRARNQY